MTINILRVPDPAGDYEIVGQDSSKELIYKDIATGELYVDGETLETFGVENLRENERRILGLYV